MTFFLIPMIQSFHLSLLKIEHLESAAAHQHSLELFTYNTQRHRSRFTRRNLIFNFLSRGFFPLSCVGIYLYSRIKRLLFQIHNEIIQSFNCSSVHLFCYCIITLLLNHNAKRAKWEINFISEISFYCTGKLL